MKSILNVVAKHYDLMNFLASLGQEKFWRRAAHRTVVTHPGMRVFDVAAGTRTSAIEFARAGAEVITVDLPRGMIHERQVRHPELDSQQASAMNLKSVDNSFNAVTISFGLRNVTDPDQTLREFHRVLRPGGHPVVCGFSRPTQAPFQALCRFFLGVVLSPIAHLMFSDAMVYDYLTESILA